MRRYIGAILTILVCVACGTQAAKKTYTQRECKLDSLKKKAKDATSEYFSWYPYICEFPEGPAKMIQWAKDNIRIPDGFIGRERVVVMFMIQPDGTVTDGKILRGSENEEVNAEALRLVNALPKFYVKFFTPKKEPIPMAWPIMFEANDSID